MWCHSIVLGDKQASNLMRPRFPIGHFEVGLLVHTERWKLLPIIRDLQAPRIAKMTSDGQWCCFKWWNYWCGCCCFCSWWCWRWVEQQVKGYLLQKLPSKMLIAILLLSYMYSRAVRLSSSQHNAIRLSKKMLCLRCYGCGCSDTFYISVSPACNSLSTVITFPLLLFPLSLCFQFLRQSYSHGSILQMFLQELPQWPKDALLKLSNAYQLSHKS